MKNSSLSVTILQGRYNDFKAIIRDYPTKRGLFFESISCDLEYQFLSESELVGYRPVLVVSVRSVDGAYPLLLFLNRTVSKSLYDRFMLYMNKRKHTL